jgi:NAD(P)H-hydrate epimerase
MITGSKKYRGAAHLALEAALRGGVGLVSFAGIAELVTELSARFPEAVYKTVGDISEGDDALIGELTELSKSYGATLLGSGSDNTDGLLKLTLSLLSSEGGALILDADAINALSLTGERGVEAIKNSPREVIITPHPLEFARLIGSDVASVQLHRIEYAERFAKENSCIVVLKGAGTIVTDGDIIHINTAGSSALAKAGSGDVLAGFMASFLAQKKVPSLCGAAISVYFHAVAGDNLAEEFSSYGVTPSDLPMEIARQMAKFER